MNRNKNFTDREFWRVRRKKGLAEEMEELVETATMEFNIYQHDNFFKPENVDLDELRKELRGYYDHDTINALMKEIKLYQMYLSDNYRPASQHRHTQVLGHENVSESAVCNLLEDSFNTDRYVTEYEITGTGINRDIRADYYIEESDTVIECKSSEKGSITRGIGQCLLYQENGYDVIFLTPVYWEDLTNIMKRENICFLFADVQHDHMEPLSRPRLLERIYGHWRYKHWSMS
jgi:hypothetical protein